MTGTNVSLSQQVSQNMGPKAMQDFPSSSPDYYFDFAALFTDLSEPDHEHHATSESQAFTGVNGEVDHFIFDTDIDGGNYIINNYEPGSDWLIFVSDPNESVEITAINGNIIYRNNTDSAHGRVQISPVEDVFGISIATITETSMFI